MQGLSFVLTMWYVNVLIQEKLTEKISSFILTMWYVNYRIRILESKQDYGFILTMWYVNSALYIHNQYISFCCV